MHNSFKSNFILNVDCYKNDHDSLVKNGVLNIESNIIARKPSEFSSEIVMDGIQIFAKKLSKVLITKEDIDEAELEFMQMGYDFDRSRWEYIISEYGGKIPLTIRALKEGQVVPIGCPLVRVFTTDSNVRFLSTYIETNLQRAIWYPSTIASNVRSIKKFLSSTMKRHCGHENVDFHLHDFGDRGAHCEESAIIAGMSHAKFFKGSDCASANRSIKYWYDTDKAYVSSIVATEHSISCSNSDANQKDDFEIARKVVNLLEHKTDLFYREKKGIPIVSVVIDTYDAYRFTREFIGDRLKSRIIELGKKGGKLVLRPDSGDPLTIPIEIIKILMDAFGYMVNENGYKVLPSYLGVIQGDGVNEGTIRQIIQNLDKEKISLENLVFGMGGQLVAPSKGRDTFSFAMKATAQILEDGSKMDLFKDPVTDSGKRSLRGRVTTYKRVENGNEQIFAERISFSKDNPSVTDLMVDFYINGDVMNLDDFDTICERANSGIYTKN